MSQHPPINLARLIEKLERIRFGLQMAEARIREDNPVFADVLSDLAEETEGATYVSSGMPPSGRTSETA